MSKFLIRSFLKFWAKTAIAPGYLYQVCETWGKYLANSPIESRLFNGCKVICNLQDHIQRQMFFFGAFEPVESYLFNQFIQPGMIVIDIGANIGNYTLIACKAVGQSGMVYSFEPVDTNFKMLSRHIEMNILSDIVQLENLGVWSENKFLQFSLFDTELDDNFTNYIMGEYDNVAKTTGCLSVSLDKYFEDKNIDRLDLIKMDIEGSEYFALQGAKNLIEKFRPVILMEINRINCQTIGYDSNIIADFFKELDYKMYLINGTSDNSYILSDLKNIDRANILCYYGTLPNALTKEWDLKSILKQNFPLKINR